MNLLLRQHLQLNWEQDASHLRFLLLCETLSYSLSFLWSSIKLLPQSLNIMKSQVINPVISRYHSPHMLTFFCFLCLYKIGLISCLLLFQCTFARYRLQTCNRLLPCSLFLISIQATVLWVICEFTSTCRFLYLFNVGLYMDLFLLLAWVVGSAKPALWCL
jgi:hypothetical protein